MRLYSVFLIGIAASTQLNVGPLPMSLAGKGTSNVVLTVDGMTANTVTVSIQ